MSCSSGDATWHSIEIENGSQLANKDRQVNSIAFRVKVQFNTVEAELA